MTTGHTVIRAIQDADFQWLDEIENGADTLLIDILRRESWQSAPPGTSRHGHQGFSLVAESTPVEADRGHVGGRMGFIDV